MMEAIRRETLSTETASPGFSCQFWYENEQIEPTFPFRATASLMERNASTNSGEISKENGSDVARNQVGDSGKQEESTLERMVLSVLVS